MAVRNIRRPRQFLTITDIGFILGVIVLVVGLFIANVYVARTLKGGEWLFLRWNAARAYAFEHIDPYGSTIAQQVQSFAYGREAYLNEYPYVLNDPFYIVLVYVPLALISDFSIAHAVWMLASQAALVAIVLLTLRLSEWQPPSWLTACLIAFALFGSFSVLAFVSGSSAIFMMLFALLALAAIQADANELAGVLLLLIAYQWEISALFFLFILVYVLANRRWGVLAGFGMSLITLVIISLLLNSNWIVPYVRAVLFDWSRRIDYTFGTTLSYIFPHLTISLDRWVAIVVTAILFLETLQSVYEHSRHVAWVAFLALALNPLLGFAIFPVNQVVLLPAIILIIVLVWERWIHQRVWVSLLLLLAIFTSAYALYFQTLDTPFRLYSDLLKILPPLVITLGLYWMRWWAMRAPRLWADQFGVHKVHK